MFRTRYTGKVGLLASAGALVATGCGGGGGGKSMGAGSHGESGDPSIPEEVSVELSVQRLRVARNQESPQVLSGEDGRQYVTCVSDEVDTLLFAFDEDGALDWSQEFPGLHRAARTSDGGVVLMEEERSAAIKLSSEGSIEWDQNFGFFGSEFGEWIGLPEQSDAAPLQYLLFAGESDELVKIDLEGQVLWDQEWPAGDGGHAPFLASDGGAYFLAREAIARIDSERGGDWSILLQPMVGNGCFLLPITALECSDGGHLLVGLCSGLWLSKVDVNGEIAWQTVLDSDEGSPAVSRVAGSPSTGYFLASSDWILRFAPDGSLLWDTQITTPDAGFLGRIEPRPTGGCVLYGSTERGGEGSDGWILALDENGELELDCRIDVAVEDFLVRALATGDGGLLIAGQSSDSLERPLAWIAKLDAGNATVWQRTYSEQRGGVVLGDLVRLSDGHFAFAATRHVGEGNGDLVMAEFDGNGNFLWSREVPDVTNGPGAFIAQPLFQSLNMARIGADGILFATVETSSGSEDEDLVLVRARRSNGQGGCGTESNFQTSRISFRAATTEMSRLSNVVNAGVTPMTDPAGFLPAGYAPSFRGLPVFPSGVSAQNGCDG